VAERDDDIPETEEELAAARRLRDALEDPSIDDPDADLARALAAAYAPSTLEDVEHARLVDDVASPEELASAAALARALDAEPLTVALRAAWSPRPLDEADHHALVARAVGAAPRSGLGSVPGSARRARVVRVAFGAVAGAVALAASVLVWVDGRAPHEVPIARARSTQPLFDEPFRAGDASARIDRIAMARASDFRDNRFAGWGVR